MKMNSDFIRKQHKEAVYYVERLGLLSSDVKAFSDCGVIPMWHLSKADRELAMSMVADLEETGNMVYFIDKRKNNLGTALELYYVSPHEDLWGQDRSAFERGILRTYSYDIESWKRYNARRNEK